MAFVSDFFFFFTSENVFEVDPTCSIYWYFVSFYIWIKFHYLNIPKYHNFSRLPTDGHLGYFYFSALTNYIAMKMWALVIVWTYVFISFESIPQRGRVSLVGYILLGHKIILCFINWGIAKLFSKVSVPFYSCGIIQYVSFCDWLISYIIMSSRFIHVIAHFQFPSFLRLIFHCMDISYSDYLFICW